MDTNALLDAQRKLAAQTGTTNKVITRAETPEDDKKPDETNAEGGEGEPKPDPEEDDKDKELDDLKARVKALEDKLNEQEKETEEALATATQTMADATAALKLAAERFKDPAFAQACALGEHPTAKSATPAQTTPVTTNATILAKWQAMTPGSAESIAFYKENAVAIATALNA